METACLSMPGPVLFLLLVVPPPGLCTGNFLKHFQSWRDVYKDKRHHKRGVDLETACKKNFDVYFVLDASSDVQDDWNSVCKFVDAVIKKYRDSCCPNTRFSIITYNKEGTTHMSLTSDKSAIKNGMEKLKSVVPGGKDRNLPAGLSQANQQIVNMYGRDTSTASVIISLIAGPMNNDVVNEASSQINKAKHMGTLPVALGIKNSQENQVRNFAKDISYLYFPEVFEEMSIINRSIVLTSCSELLNLDTVYYCLGEDYSIIHYFKEMDKVNKDALRCLYKKDGVIGKYLPQASQLPYINCIFLGHPNTHIITDYFLWWLYSMESGRRKLDDIKPAVVKERYILCPGIIFTKPGESVEMDLSTDYGRDAKTRKYRSRSDGKECEKTEDYVDIQTTPTTPSTTTQETSSSTIITTTPELLVVKEAPSKEETSIKALLILGLPIFVLLFCCIFYCSWTYEKKPKKRTKPRKMCSLVIFPCMCQEESIMQMEEKLDSLCDFFQTSNFVPFIWGYPICENGKADLGSLQFSGLVLPSRKIEQDDQMNQINRMINEPNGPRRMPKYQPMEPLWLTKLLLPKSLPSTQSTLSALQHLYLGSTAQSHMFIAFLQKAAAESSP